MTTIVPLCIDDLTPHCWKTYIDKIANHNVRYTFFAWSWNDESTIITARALNHFQEYLTLE